VGRFSKVPKPDGLINVRAETLRDKPTFRSDFLHRRCVVIADGFCEWKAKRTGKTPYRIHSKRNGPVAFACIWEQEPEKRFAIVTTAANTLLKPIHLRMPLIFMPDECGKWLADNATIPKLLETLEPRAYRGMEAYEVSRRVNKATADTPDLITRSKSAA
jgi:putative SOS response-associated peptidase YedK